jgi:hypothetical protein
MGNGFRNGVCGRITHEGGFEAAAISRDGQACGRLKRCFGPTCRRERQNHGARWSTIESYRVVEIEICIPHS